MADKRKETPLGEADCKTCGAVKPLSEFPKKGPHCKVCHSDKQRSLRLKRFFNLTAEEYDKMLAHQKGVCAICLQSPKKVRLAIDHCHKTGLIRGLLCAFCNRAIGVFRDNLERFKNTVNYLQSPPATIVLGEPRFGIKGRVTNKAKTRKRLNKV